MEEKQLQLISLLLMSGTRLFFLSLSLSICRRKDQLHEKLFELDRERERERSLPTRQLNIPANLSRNSIVRSSE